MATLIIVTRGCSRSRGGAPRTRLTASPGRGLAGAGGQGEEEGSGMLSFDLNGNCRPSTKTKLYQGDEQLFNENALGWSSRVAQQK